ncbi:hypothetical protein TNCV_4428361 [Trichonephila clavipes]|nr:hypothetical protein TNCV_4428361 [Trichonephila clavipes]
MPLPLALVLHPGTSGLEPATQLRRLSVRNHDHQPINPAFTYDDQCEVTMTIISMFLARIKRSRGSLVVNVTNSWLAFHEFEPSTMEDPPCRVAMHVKTVESSNVLPLVWCGSLERGVPAQVSSSSLDHGSK